jgi:anthranilate phosphoribosyltransferase
MKATLEYLFNHQFLSYAEAKLILGQISEGLFPENQVSAFLTVFKMRSISIDELRGFRDCLRERCIDIDLSDFNPIDLCGTGGDGKNTFNISTLASFVVAGAGYKVAKHGNYGVSSSCGSSNVIEYLGYRFTTNADVLKKQLDQSGICFLHAPLFHPALKNVAPIRRALGVPTFFNMLGPMVNPSFPKRQIVGVYSLELQRYYKYMYETEGVAFRILHALDGYDEISLTCDTKVASESNEYMLKPTDFISEKLIPEALFGGDTIAEAAKIFVDVLGGSGTAAQNQAVAANAALAIQCCQPKKSLSESYSLAMESLQSGQANQAFEKLLRA